MSRPLIIPPLRPYIGTRQIDDFGAGGFGAPRIRDGKARTHKGLDFLGEPDHEAVAPFDSRAWPPHGFAYADPKAGLRSIHLLGVGPWDGLRAVLLYVEPSIITDAHVVQGVRIGRLQDVSGYHSRPGKHMDNHLHFELYELVNKVWALRNPADFLKV